MRRALLPITLAVLSAVLAHADCPGSERPFRTSIVTYFELPDQPATSRDPRCSIVRGPSGIPVCRIRLMGILHEPLFASILNRVQYPAIVYNHGSGKVLDIETHTCALANFFVPKGYVIFYPFRRGNGLGNTATSNPNDLDPQNSSTGRNILETKDAFVNSPTPQATFDTTCTNLPCFTVELLNQESLDVAEGFNWLRKRNEIDENAIALMGNSYGAMVTVLANRMRLGNKAAVAFSPGGESWHVSAISAMLLDAARSAVRPAFYLQAKWDHDTRASVELAAAHAYGGLDPLHGEPFMASIFDYPKPALDANGVPDYQSVHVGFARSPARWGVAVVDFLKRNGVE